MLTAIAAIAWGMFASGCVSGRAGHDPTIAAERRAVAFLKREVPAWSRDNGCFSCHNNGDAARALYAATQRGYRLSDSILAETTRWVSTPSGWDENKGDPGFSDQRLADVQFAAALVSAWETGHTRDRAALGIAARRLIALQAPDGSWPIDTANAVGSPATYGTTLATVMAWQTLRGVDAAAVREARDRTDRWLGQAPFNNTPGAAALLLWSAWPGDEQAARQRNRALAFLSITQTTDGGWGPYAATPAEVFDTAVALLGLAGQRARSGVPEMIARGRAFLVAQQLPEGSWPATTRPTGGASYAQQMSTTGWATLALLATRPAAP